LVAFIGIKIIRFLRKEERKEERKKERKKRRKIERKEGHAFIICRQEYLKPFGTSSHM